MESVLAIIEQALRDRGVSARRASIEAIGKPDLIREMRRGREPSVKRLHALCRVLDLEFYVGPKRNRPDADAEHRAVRPPWVDELKSEVRALRSDVRESVTILLRTKKGGGG